MEILLIVFFIFMLVVVPMMMFGAVRFIFRVFRFIPKFFNTMYIPYLQETDEDVVTPDGDDNGYSRYKKYQMSPEQIEFMKNSFMGKQVEFNPKYFREKTKKRLSVVGMAVGGAALAVVLYKLLVVVYDYLLVTYF